MVGRPVSISTLRKGPVVWMNEVQTVRNALVSGLHEHTGRPVVMLEQAQKKPSYPFLGYKLTTPYAPESGQPVETWEPVPGQGQDFESDIQYTQTEQPQLIVSFTAYSMNDEAALELALQAHAWLSYFGREYLTDHHLVLVEITPVQNRDVLVVEDYERRQGFDATFRTALQRMKVVPSIESAELGEE